MLQCTLQTLGTRVLTYAADVVDEFHLIGAILIIAGVVSAVFDAIHPKKTVSDQVGVVFGVERM